MKKFIITMLYGGAIGWIVGTVIKTEVENRRIRRRIEETRRMLDEIDEAIADLDFDEAIADKTAQEPAK